MSIATSQGGGRGAAGEPPLAKRSGSRPLPWCVAVLLVGCAGAPLDQMHDALDVAADVADPAYEATVVACLAAERLALARAGTDEAAWTEARDRIRPVCDRAIEAWEAAATAHASSRAAVDACAAAPDATCIAKALRAAKDAKAAIENAVTAWNAAKLELERVIGPEPTCESRWPFGCAS